VLSPELECSHVDRVAHETNTGPEPFDLEKTEELTTDDLLKPSEQITEDLETNPVKKRLDSSQWITSW
jgi:hypothetical protein